MVNKDPELNRPVDVDSIGRRNYSGKPGGHQAASAEVDWSYLIARGTLQRGDGRVPMVGIAEVHPKRFKRRLWPKKRARTRNSYSSDQRIAWTFVCVLWAILGVLAMTL